MMERSAPVPQIDVVILTWNDGELLERAVRSALESRGVHVNVLVVDNGSEPAAVVPGDRRVRLVRMPTNLGVARGRNVGVRAGVSPLVALVDSDAAVYPDTLRALADAVLQPGVALAAPVVDGQAPEASAGRAPSLWRKVARGLNLTDRYAAAPRDPRAPCWDVDFAIGACQLFRRSAFEQLGGLNEDYFFGPEDVDFCLRLREAGWSVVQVAAARCEHPARRRFRGLLTRRGARHALAVAAHLWRHRHYRREGQGSWRPSTSS